jgi:TPR repeat protein
MKTSLSLSAAACGCALIALTACQMPAQPGQAAATTPTLSAKDLAVLQTAAQAGDPEAEHKLAHYYYAIKDYTNGHAWCLKAAAQGNAACEANIGDDYYYGTGVPKDLAQSVAWFRKASDGGDPRGR